MKNGKHFSKVGCCLAVNRAECHIFVCVLLSRVVSSFPEVIYYCDFYVAILSELTLLLLVGFLGNGDICFVNLLLSAS